MRRHASAYLSLTLMALFLALNHVVGRWVQGEIPPVGLSFWRWVIGAIIILPWVLRNGGSPMRILRRDLKSYMLLGGLMIGSTTLVLLALNFTTAINVSVINVVQPVLTVLFAWLWLSERLTAGRVLGVMAATLGVLFMLSKGDWQTVSGMRFNGGDMIALLAMCGFAGYAINLRLLPQGLSSVHALFGIAVVGSGLLLPFYLAESFFYRPMPLSFTTLGAVLVLALLVSVFGMLLWNYGNRYVGPSRAAIFINLIPVFGAVLATLLLGETLHGYHLAGAVCIFIGIWLVAAPGLGAKAEA